MAPRFTSSFSGTRSRLVTLNSFPALLVYTSPVDSISPKLHKSPFCGELFALNPDAPSKTFVIGLNLPIILTSANSLPVETLSEAVSANRVLDNKYKSILSSFILITRRAKGPEFAVKLVSAREGTV